MIAQFKANLTCALVFFMLLACSSLTQAQQSPEELAERSANSWLALIDSGKYAESWAEASSLFQQHVSKEQWQQMLHAARDPLGNMIARKRKSATYTKSLPGAPDGKYVVIQYDTSFTNKKSAVETVTPMLDKDGKWRVSGYFIK